jgi:hypothetical protein
MLDITASVRSPKSPPALSPDTPIVFDNLPVTEYSQYPSDFIDDDFDEFDLSEKPLGSLSQSLVGEVD